MTKESNDELKSMLPQVKKEFELMASTNFTDYENKLSETTNRAIAALQGIIDDGTLSLDPEQLVKAVDTLTRAKINILDSRRKLLETLLKGEIMLKALEPPENKKSETSVFEDYINKKTSTVSNVNSIFNDIDNSN